MGSNPLGRIDFSMSDESAPNAFYARDPVASSVWRRIVAASNQFELSLERGESIDPHEFALRFHDIPKELLVPELQQLQSEHPLLKGPLDWLDTDSQPSGRYVELELIGTGGMGEVYRGLDQECLRFVAIKKIRKEHQDNPEARERFLAEVEMTAGLEHPGIIPVYGTGTDGQGRAFYAMRLISGEGSGTLSESIRAFHKPREKQGIGQAIEDQIRLANRSDQLRDLVRRLVDVTDTVAYAHHRDIVHRDLKPSNVLIGPYGETLVADWGLARKINASAHNGIETGSNGLPDRSGFSDSSQTSATIGVGTPGYAAPEMASGAGLEELRLADIYSLGAILHCILTGASPGKGQELAACDLDVPAVQSIAAIARKAMAPEGSARYATAEAFRDDLLKWIAGEPVSARPEGWWEKAIRWPSRHRSTATGLASALAITFVAGTAFLLYQSRQATLFKNQSVQLRIALNDSESYLQQTQQAKQNAETARQQAELALGLAEQREREAIESRRLAEKRGDLAFDGLIRFQELVTTNNQVFRSAELNSLHDELTGKSNEIFQAILSDIEQELVPSRNSLKRLGETTHRLAAMESILKNDDAANAIFSRTCEWMRQRLESKHLSAATEQFVQLQIGKLRSLQGTLLMRTGNHLLAKPNLMDSIQRLGGLLSDPSLIAEDQSQAVSSLACSLSSLSMHELYAGNIDNAKMLQEQAIARLGTTEPGNYDEAMVHVQVHGNMSVLHEKASQADQALKELEIASELAENAEGMIRENPGGILDPKVGVKPTTHHVQLRAHLAHERARLLVAKQEDAAAVDVLRSQLKWERESIKQISTDPANIESYQGTATKLQDVMISTGDHQGALELSENWVKFAEEIRTGHPSSDSTLLFLVFAHHSAGHLQERLGLSENAIERYRKALEVCESANPQRPYRSSIAYQRVELEMHLFHFQLAASQWSEADQSFQRAVDSAEALVEVSDDQRDMLPYARAQLARGIAAMRASQREADALKWEAELVKKKLAPQ
jgi:serine/threonine protein kinase